MNREPVAVQVARKRPVWGRLPPISLHWKWKFNPQGPCNRKQALDKKLRRNILAIVPATPSSRMGYAGRNSETEPTPTSSSSGDLV